MANGTITMDADEFITRLTRAKVSRPQAEAIVKGIVKDARFNTDELATKHDIELIRKYMENLEERLIRKIYHAQILTIGINAAVFAALLTIFEYLR